VPSPHRSLPVAIALMVWLFDFAAVGNVMCTRSILSRGCCLFGYQQAIASTRQATLGGCCGVGDGAEWVWVWG